MKPAEKPAKKPDFVNFLLVVIVFCAFNITSKPINERITAAKYRIRIKMSE